jgi:hypothetical protein
MKTAWQGALCTATAKGLPKTLVIAIWQGHKQRAGGFARRGLDEKVSAAGFHLVEWPEFEHALPYLA